MAITPLEIQRPWHRAQIQRFKVLAELGSGGMGTVYRALDPQLEREVAIKVIARSSRKMASGLSARETLDLACSARGSGVDLMTEARMMARLSHPNVLPVYEVGLADGAVFVVMEHIEGCNLATWLTTPRELDDILHVLAQAGRGLAAAHLRGIVHRDFKPENVLVGDDGRVRVADFGLSQLTTTPGAMVRIAVTAGTPGYMAPEIVRGEHATIASDVFAFATALAEALGSPPGSSSDERERRLRDRGVSLRLRTAIAAGLARDPRARCSLDVLITGLAGSRGQWRRRGSIAAALALVALVALAGAPFAATDDDRCATPSWLVARWQPERRAELVLALAARTTRFAGVPRIAATVDRTHRAIAGELAATCTAERRGELTRAQAAGRKACLERRAFELTGVVNRTLSVRDSLAAASTRAVSIADVDTCRELVARPLGRERAGVEALYARYVASWELRGEDGERELVAIEQAATRAGERELATRAALRLARQLGLRDKLVHADTVAQRAHRRAIEIDGSELAASALVERSRIASLRGDATSAANYAQLARELVDRPGTAKRSRARVHGALGRAHNDRGEYKVAITELERGLALVEQIDERIVEVELPLRITYVHTLAADGQGERAVKAARETVEIVKGLVGDRDPNYAVALNMLAYSLRSNHDLERALPIRRHALSVLLDTLPADDSHVLLQRGDLADDLYSHGEFEQARNDYVEVLAAADHNETLRGSRVKVLPAYALATFHSGRITEGLQLHARAYEASLAQFGAQHPWTLAVLWQGVDLHLEVGDLERAERYLGLMITGYRDRADDALSLALSRGVLGADLANLRGKPALAEKLAREALVACDTLDGNDTQRVDLYYVLADSLLRQRRFAAARTAIETAYELARKTQQRADTVAWIEALLATVEAAQGLNAEAHNRAIRARAVLERYPGRLRARALASAAIANARS